LKPVLPRLASESEAFLGVAPLQWSDAEKLLEPGHAIRPYQHLIARVEDRQLDQLLDSQAGKPQQHSAKEQAVNSEISIDDFNKLDLRVARIARAEQVEGADKLVKLTLEVGDGTRTVFAGIKADYAPEKLEGRLAVL